MPRFSEDEVIDFCVAEAVVRAGQEAAREGREATEENAAQAQRVEGHRAKAEELGML